VAAEAGAAGAGADDAAGVGEDFHEAFLQALAPDFGSGGQNDAAHALADLAAAQDIGRVEHIRVAAVGAGADDHLIYLHVPEFGDVLHV